MNLSATFLNRFDFKIKTAKQVVHPLTGEVFLVSRNIQAYSFRRAFGEIVQFRLASGLLRRNRLVLSAVSLAAGDDREADRANPDFLQQVSGSTGLDLADDAFHCVGLFSQHGWSEERKTQVEISGKAIFYLVQKGESTLWHVYGPEGSLKQLFDLETADEKKERALTALHANSRLILPGDQVPMEIFLKEQHLDIAVLLPVVRESKGHLEIIEHKGKHYIQRSVR